MRLLLDTEAFLILARGEADLFTPRARALVEDEENSLLVSTVSFVEIAVKASIQKLAATAADISKGVADLRLTVIPFESHHALRMFDLPLHHRDPFDRMLIATALSEGVPVVGRDREFRKYRGLKVIS